MGSSGGIREWSNAWPRAIPGFKVAETGQIQLGGRIPESAHGGQWRASLGPVPAKRNARKGLDAGATCGRAGSRDSGVRGPHARTDGRLPGAIQKLRVLVAQVPLRLWIVEL